ncbi:MAG: accessory gene regulator B family protein [Romboutsia sp.]
MVESLTNKVISFFIQKSFIVEDKYEIYKSKITQFIYFIISLGSVVIIGLIFNKAVQGIILLICYILIRCFACGYKPDNYIIRLLMFIAIFLFTIYVSDYDDLTTYKSLVITFTMLSFGGIYMLSPVEDRKKPLKGNFVIRYKIISRILAFIMTLITMVLLGTYSFNEYAAYMCAALFWSAIMLVLGTIKNYIF